MGVWLLVFWHTDAKICSFTQATFNLQQKQKNWIFANWVDQPTRVTVSPFAVDCRKLSAVLLHERWFPSNNFCWLLSTRNVRNANVSHQANRPNLQNFSHDLPPWSQIPFRSVLQWNLNYYDMHLRPVGRPGTSCYFHLYSCYFRYQVRRLSEYRNWNHCYFRSNFRHFWLKQ